jgi:hypothetical protein
MEKGKKIRLMGLFNIEVEKSGKKIDITIQYQVLNETIWAGVDQYPSLLLSIIGEPERIIR